MSLLIVAHQVLARLRFVVMTSIVIWDMLNMRIHILAGIVVYTSAIIIIMSRLGKVFKLLKIKRQVK